ncbi:MAG: DUF2231 domain-containing protein [Sulfurimonadaceae bacterium]|jgi:uncharacterized membrane protein|nr:DUF2231 domain-containing protein [Sulfurimonadaceae bacterium]
MIHPPLAHFAIVLPIATLVLGLAYIYRPSALMSKISTRFMVFATIFLIAAFFTGKAEGALAYETLSKEGQATLLEHKDLGLYIVLSFAFATLLKFVGCFKKLLQIELISIVIVAVVVAGILYQGKLGGEITYTYGANVKNHADGLTCIDDPEFYLELKAD